MTIIAFKSTRIDAFRRSIEMILFNYNVKETKFNEIFNKNEQFFFFFIHFRRDLISKLFDLTFNGKININVYWLASVTDDYVEL